MTKIAIITAIANQADAVAMSVSGGVAQSMFAALATTSATGHSPSATHCWANGEFEDATIALYQADPRFQLKPPAVRGRDASVVLAECTPTLYSYLGT